MENCTLTNACMIYDEKGNILVLNRKDPVFQGLSFPGGHVEPGESFVRSTIREVKEETGLEVSNLVLCGVKQFISTNDNSRYIVFYYKTKDFKGVITPSSEGDVFWINRQDIKKYDLTPDFTKMLKIFENDNLSEQYYSFDGTWKLELL